jgi:hypothetical protein
MRKAYVAIGISVGFVLGGLASASALPLSDSKTNMSVIEQAAKKKPAAKPKCEQKLIFKCCMKGKQEICTL